MLATGQIPSEAPFTRPEAGLASYPFPVSVPFPVTDDPIRADFPILSRTVGSGAGKPLAYLDNAATAQKPRRVIDAVTRFYEHENANIHRGVHYLSMHATDAYDGARERIAQAIGAAHPAEVVFVRGTTEGINLIAQTYGRKFLQPGD